MVALAQRGCRPVRWVSIALLLCLAVWISASPQDLLDQASSQFQAGRTDAALATLRTLRFQFPDAPESRKALALSIQIALSRHNEYSARYFLELFTESAPSSPELGQAAVMVADYCYAEASYVAALDYYQTAINTTADFPGLSHALLRAAELEIYHKGDQPAAEGFFHRCRKRACRRTMPKRMRTFGSAFV